MTQGPRGPGAGQTAQRDRLVHGITATTDEQVFVRGVALDEAIGAMSFPAMLLRLWRGDAPPRGRGRRCWAPASSPRSTTGRWPRRPSWRARSRRRGRRPMSALAGGILSFGELHGAVVTRAMRILATVPAEGDLEAWADDVFEVGAGRRSPAARHRPSLAHHGPARRAPARAADGSRPTARQHRRPCARSPTRVGRHVGRPVAVNIDGALAVALTALRLDPEYGDFLFAIARSFGLAAHIVEERARERPMRLIDPTAALLRRRPRSRQPHPGDRLDEGSADLAIRRCRADLDRPRRARHASQGLPLRVAGDGLRGVHGRDHRSSSRASPARTTSTPSPRRSTSCSPARARGVRGRGGRVRPGRTRCGSPRASTTSTGTPGPSRSSCSGSTRHRPSCRTPSGCAARARSRAPGRSASLIDPVRPPPGRGRPSFAAGPRPGGTSRPSRRGSPATPRRPLRRTRVAVARPTAPRDGAPRRAPRRATPPGRPGSPSVRAAMTPSGRIRTAPPSAEPVAPTRRAGRRRSAIDMVAGAASTACVPRLDPPRSPATRTRSRPGPASSAGRHSPRPIQTCGARWPGCASSGPRSSSSPSSVPPPPWTIDSATLRRPIGPRSAS